MTILSRRPRDPRLPALGLIALAMSEPDESGPEVDQAWRELCRDAVNADALIPALIEVAVHLVDDLEAYTGADGLWALQRVALRLQRQRDNYVWPYFTVRTTDPAAPGTDREDPTMGLLNRKKDTTIDPEREALLKIFEGRPTVSVATGRVAKPEAFTPETARQIAEARIDSELAAHGFTYDDSDPENPVVRLTELDRDNRDDNWFTWTEAAWVEATDVARGAAWARADRFKRAHGLAYLGRLTPAEVRHVRWLAEADNPFESLSDPTGALTREQARIVLAEAESRPQNGRTDRIDPNRGFTAGLDGLWESR